MRRRGPVLLLLLSLASVLAALEEGEVQLFRSNSLGMALEKVDPVRRDEFPWILEIRREGEREIRSLFREGEEDSRTERETIRGELVRETVRNAEGVQDTVYSQGRIDRIRETDNSGKEILRQYLYEGSRLREIRVTRDGKELYRDLYTLGSRGELLRVNREFPEDPEYSSRYGYRNGLPVREWFSRDGEAELFLSDRNNRESRETWQEGKLYSRVSWRQEGTVLVRITEYPGENRVIRSEYDGNHRLIRETEESEGREAVSEYIWEEETLKEKIIRSPEMLERYVYEYREGELFREEKYRNRKLVLVSLFPEEGRRVEETYRNGELLATVTYVNDLPVSTEYPEVRP